MSDNPDVIEDSANPSSPKRTSSRSAKSDSAKKSSSSNVVNDEGQTVITNPSDEKPKSAPKSNVHTKDESAVIGSHAADRALGKTKSEPAQTDKPVTSKKTAAKKAAAKKAAAPKIDKNKTAIWALKHMRWNGVGELQRGYNIVTKEVAEKWLERNGVREATPEEVAAHFGK